MSERDLKALSNEDLLAELGKYGDPAAQPAPVSSLSDEELLAQIGASSSPAAQPAPISSLSDDQLRAMLKEHNVEVPKPTKPVSLEGRITKTLEDAGLPINEVMAPLRQINEEQKALNPIDRVLTKAAGVGRGLIDLAEIAPNLTLAARGMLPQDKNIDELPFIRASQGTHDVMEWAKRQLDQSNVAKQAPHLYNSEAFMGQMLAPLPNVSVAGMAAKAGLPAWHAAVEAGKIIPTMADMGLVGGAFGGAQNISEQVNQGEGIDPRKAGLAAALGAGLGAGLGGIASGFRKMFWHPGSPELPPSQSPQGAPPTPQPLLPQAKPVLTVKGKVLLPKPPAPTPQENQQALQQATNNFVDNFVAQQGHAADPEITQLANMRNQIQAQQQAEQAAAAQMPLPEAMPPEVPPPAAPQAPAAGSIEDEMLQLGLDPTDRLQRTKFLRGRVQQEQAPEATPPEPEAPPAAVEPTKNKSGKAGVDRRFRIYYGKTGRVASVITATYEDKALWSLSKKDEFMKNLKVLMGLHRFDYNDPEQRTQFVELVKNWRKQVTEMGSDATKASEDGTAEIEAPLFPSKLYETPQDAELPPPEALPPAEEPQAMPGQTAAQESAETLKGEVSENETQQEAEQAAGAEVHEPMPEPESEAQPQPESQSEAAPAAVPEREVIRPGGITDPNFRYKPEEYGHERAAKFVPLEDLAQPVGNNKPILSTDDVDAIKTVADLGAKKKYLEDKVTAQKLDFIYTHGDDKLAFSELGITGGVEMDVNLGAKSKNALLEYRAELPSTEVNTKDHIRTLTESGFGYGKDDLPLSRFNTSPDKKQALIDLTAANMDRLDAKKAYDAARTANQSTIEAAQEKLRNANPTAEGETPEHLAVLVKVPHPAFPANDILIGVETVKGAQRFELTADSKKLADDKEAELFAQEFGNITKTDWKQLTQEAWAQGFRTIPELQKAAVMMAKERGLLQGDRSPFKLRATMDARSAAKEIKEAARNQRAARPIIYGLAAAILSQLDTEAQAADGKDRKQPVAANVLAAIGAIAAVIYAGKTVNKALRTKILANMGFFFRDTMDALEKLDEYTAKAQPQTQQLNLFNNQQGGPAIARTIWEHLSTLMRSSWGIHFDNPEQLMRAVQEYKQGNVGANFNSLTPEQQTAIINQQMIRRSLSRKVEAHVKAVEDLIKNKAIAEDLNTTSGLYALRKVAEALGPAQAEDSWLGKLHAQALSNMMDFFFFWNPEHHLTNLTDQWIAGGSRIGVHNIAKANVLLVTDGALRHAFENSNLFGGMRVERAEAQAIASTGKAQNPLQRVLNTDLPSDQLNADRVGLASMLEYFAINKGAVQAAGYKNDRDFALAMLDKNSNMDPTLATDAWVHMTERLSRTLGVDPLRINKDWLSITPFSKNVMVFYRQPARMARLVTNYIGTGNVAGLFTLLGMTAALGGRAAIPKDISDPWASVDPRSYFAAARALDNLSVYQKLTGENNANKLEYGIIYPQFAASSMVATQLGGMKDKLDRVIAAAGKLGRAHSPAATKAANAELVGATQMLVKQVAPPMIPRAVGLPMRFIEKGLTNYDAATTGKMRMTFYDKGQPFPYAPPTNMKLSQLGVTPFDLAKDMVLPGTPAPIDAMKMSKLQQAKAKKALIKQPAQQPAYRDLIPKRAK